MGISLSDIGSALGSFASGVGSAIGSIVSNPTFQNAAISLGTQYLGSKISKQVAPSPYASMSIPAFPSAANIGSVFNVPMNRGRVATRAQQPGVVYPTVRTPSYATPAVSGYATRFSGAPVGTAVSGGATTFDLSSILAGGGLGTILGGILGGGTVPAFPAMNETIMAPGTTGGGIVSEVTERLVGAVAGRPSMFAYGPTRARAIPMLEAPHPETGVMHYWRHVGRPILFSGDLATCRRVNKVRGKLNRGRPRPR